MRVCILHLIFLLTTSFSVETKMYEDDVAFGLKSTMAYLSVSDLVCMQQSTLLTAVAVERRAVYDACFAIAM